MKRFAAFFWILIGVFCLSASQSQAQTAQEAVKATFLYRFASFVTWPPGAFETSETPIRICVVGADVFGALLQRTIGDQRVDGRAFDVRRVASVSPGSGCHVVYAAGDQTDATLRALHGAPVLTVTDASAGRGGTRGMIHFVIVDDHVRFHIDDARAAEGGLFISSRLLSLAVSVRRRAGA